MMLTKPLAVVVVAAAMSAAAVMSTRALRPAVPAQSTSSGASTDKGGIPGQPARNPSRVGGPAGSGPSHTNDRVNDAGHGAGGNGNNLNPTRSRVVGHRQERVKNGSYATTIAGFYSGNGTADVKDDKVSIKADVITTDGRSGQFVASNLSVDGPYFFGTGTVLGETVQVSGRVDAARASRLLATFAAGDGKAARVVGNLPSTLDAGDDNWDNGGQPTRARE